MVPYKFKPIVKTFPREWTYIHIYPVSDLHKGDAHCNITKFRAWIKQVLADPRGYVVIGGDMINNGIFGSKTNSYEETEPPDAQTDWVVNELKPLADAGRILAVVPGNHETRSWRQVGHNPAREMCIQLGILDVYRPEAAFIKIKIGTYDKKTQQVYGLLVTHGSSRLKHDKFCVAIEGVDCFISGHDHQSRIQPMCRIRFDLSHESVITIPYKEVVLPAFLEYGGYGITNEYPPQSYQDVVQIHLSGKRKKVSVSYI